MPGRRSSGRCGFRCQPGWTWTCSTRGSFPAARCARAPAESSLATATANGTWRANLAAFQKTLLQRINAMNVPMDKMLEVVREFVQRQKGDSAKSITADSKLVQDGFIDSFTLVELIVDLEKQLQISLPDGSLIPEDFETPKV